MNAQQLTLDATDALPTVVLEPGDDGSILWAMRNGRCINHHDRWGVPHHDECGDDSIPYCDDCRAEHEQRCAAARKAGRL